MSGHARIFFFPDLREVTRDTHAPKRGEIGNDQENYVSGDGPNEGLTIFYGFVSSIAWHIIIKRGSAVNTFFLLLFS